MALAKTVTVRTFVKTLLQLQICTGCYVNKTKVSYKKGMSFHSEGPRDLIDKLFLNCL